MNLLQPFSHDSSLQNTPSIQKRNRHSNHKTILSMKKQVEENNPGKYLAKIAQVDNGIVNGT